MGVAKPVCVSPKSSPSSEAIILKNSLSFNLFPSRNSTRPVIACFINNSLSSSVLSSVSPLFQLLSASLNGVRGVIICQIDKNELISLKIKS